MRILDISQPVTARTAVWPGDRPFALDWTLSQAAGDSVNVAAVSLSVHTGTHIDGFRHVLQAGAGAADMPLDAYVGPACVIDARGRAALDADLLDGVDADDTPRVLLRTRTDVDETRFPDDVAHLTPALAERLVRDGYRLVGTDAPSIDPLSSKTLDAHRILAAGKVANLENAVLTKVPPGRYILVALPLRVPDADSSPVRAVLLEGALEAWL
jgi:arylformamidase